MLRIKEMWRYFFGKKKWGYFFRKKLFFFFEKKKRGYFFWDKSQFFDTNKKTGKVLYSGVVHKSCTPPPQYFDFQKHDRYTPLPSNLVKYRLYKLSKKGLKIGVLSTVNIPVFWS